MAKNFNWFYQEVWNAFCEFNQKYFDLNGHINSYKLHKDNTVIPIARYCKDKGIEPSLFIEAQFYFLSDFYKDKGMTRFPLKYLNTSVKSIDRYNRFLTVNVNTTGSYTTTFTDVLDAKEDRQRPALLVYAVEYLSTGNSFVSRKKAEQVYSNFKVRIDEDVAKEALYKMFPSIVRYIQFEKDWDWSDLRKFLIELNLFEEVVRE